MTDEPNARSQLKSSILRRLHWRAQAFDPANAANASQALSPLRAWQTLRLGASFADVLADPAMNAAGQFFLTDLYSDRDFSARDRDIDRVMPLMVHLLPDSLLGAARDAIELHVLSHSLDLRMAAAMDRRRIRRMDDLRYGEIYREVGLPRLRQRQIDLIVAVGRGLDAAVKRHGMHRLLRAARLPARAAGLSELQGFLERGFNAFDQLGGADRFLARVSSGEGEISRRLFEGHPRPFDL